MTGRSGGRSTPPDDRIAALGGISAYSLGPGIATVTIPLRALDAGYDAAAVGFLVAIAAGCQFATRLILPALLGRFADRTLITLGSICCGVTGPMSPAGRAWSVAAGGR